MFSSKTVAVQVGILITAIGQIWNIQPMGEVFPTIGLLQCPLQMDRIRRASQQIHGLQQTVVGVDQHHLRRLGISIRKVGHLQGVVREVAPHHSWVEGMPGTQLLSVAISLDGKVVGSQIALSLKEVIYSRGLGAWRAGRAEDGAAARLASAAAGQESQCLHRRGDTPIRYLLR